MNGQTQERSETKNASGKVARVTTIIETGPSITGPSTISYSYDADGNLTTTTDPNGNQVQIVYDTKGRKSSTIDPDLGTWTYMVDGFGNLVGDVDGAHPGAAMTCARDSSTCVHVMLYDALSRMVSKTDSTGTARWIYDSPGAGIGKIAAMVSAPDARLSGTCALPAGAGVTGGQRAVKSYQYTAYGDIHEVDECADGSSFATTYQYDALGRQSSIQYPIVNSSQLAVGYHYTSLGYLQYLTEDSSSGQPVLWQAKAMNELGQVTDEEMQKRRRDGIDPQSPHRLAPRFFGDSTPTKTSSSRIGATSSTRSAISSTRNRADALNTVTSSETFTYDLTNRLLTSKVTTSGGTQSESYVYDPIGNLTQKGTVAECLHLRRGLPRRKPYRWSPCRLHRRGRRTLWL